MHSLPRNHCSRNPSLIKRPRHLILTPLQPCFETWLHIQYRCLEDRWTKYYRHLVLKCCMVLVWKYYTSVDKKLAGWVRLFTTSNIRQGQALNSLYLSTSLVVPDATLAGQRWSFEKDPVRLDKTKAMFEGFPVRPGQQKPRPFWVVGGQVYFSTKPVFFRFFFLDLTTFFPV